MFYITKLICIFQNLNLKFEKGYDENNHRDCSCYKENKKQEKIKKLLGCIFIRLLLMINILKYLKLKTKLKKIYFIYEQNQKQIIETLNICIYKVQKVIKS